MTSPLLSPAVFRVRVQLGTARARVITLPHTPNLRRHLLRLRRYLTGRTGTPQGWEGRPLGFTSVYAWHSALPRTAPRSWTLTLYDPQATFLIGPLPRCHPRDLQAAARRERSRVLCAQRAARRVATPVLFPRAA